jgi:hypothetical protein
VKGPKLSVTLKAISKEALKSRLVIETKLSLSRALAISN